VICNILESEFGLDNRVFAVTGASSGIGRIMAEFLAEAGASVILIARRQSALTEAVENIRNKGGQAASVSGDLANRETLGDIASQCQRKFGEVNGIINAAGINLRQSADEITLDSWERTLHLNLSVPFFFAREFVEDMKRRGYGRIINIASLQSVRAFPNGLPYGASKGGICQLTRAMAEAWSRYGITSNAIAPGFFPTALTAPIFNDHETANKIAEQTAIGRNGKLEDLRGATIFFASKASEYVTGQTLYVDGGFTAK